MIEIKRQVSGTYTLQLGFGYYEGAFEKGVGAEVSQVIGETKITGLYPIPIDKAEYMLKELTTAIEAEKAAIDAAKGGGG